jgi:hypothetical protein
MSATTTDNFNRDRAGRYWRAHGHLTSGRGTDGLRADLRRAIALRDAADAAVATARAELGRLTETRVGAMLALARFGSLDAERAAARTAAIRAGRPATDPPEMAAKLAEREAARTHLGDVDRAVEEVRDEVAKAEADAGVERAKVEALAAALTAAEVESLADKLVDLERRAAAIRVVVRAVTGSFLTAPGFGASFELPTTQRTITLLREPPANDLAGRDDNPGLKKEDERTREAFREHARKLLADPDARLVATLAATLG